MRRGAPVLLLLGVAAIQIYHAEVLDLTAWKGGGFGMFSTLDGRDNRRLIVTLVRRRSDQEERQPAALPRTARVARLAKQARAMPSAERVQALADALAAQPWRIDQKLADGAPEKARVIREAWKQRGTRVVDFDFVEVSLWKVRFDAHPTNMLAPRAELVRTLRAERPPLRALHARVSP
jgi:hypothetical protein